MALDGLCLHVCTCLHSDGPLCVGCLPCLRGKHCRYWWRCDRRPVLFVPSQQLKNTHWATSLNTFGINKRLRSYSLVVYIFCIYSDIFFMLLWALFRVFYYCEFSALRTMSVRFHYLRLQIVPWSNKYFGSLKWGGLKLSSYKRPFSPSHIVVI